MQPQFTIWKKKHNIPDDNLHLKIDYDLFPEMLLLRI